MDQIKSFIERRIIIVLIAPATTILAGLSLFPFCYSIYFATRRYFLTKPWVSRNFIGLEHFKSFASDSYFSNAVTTLLKFAFSSVALEMVFGLALALLLVRRVRGTNSLKVLLLLPMMVTPVAAGLIWRLILNPSFGPANWLTERAGLPAQVWLGSDFSLASVIAVEVWQWMPLSLLIFTVSLLAIPRDQFEAASIDGANQLQTFIHITLPYLKKPAIIIAILRLSDAFKSFDKIFVMTGGGPGIKTQTLALYTYKKAFIDFDIGYGAALSFLMLFMILAISIPVIRFLLNESTGSKSRPAAKEVEYEYDLA